MLRLGKIGTGWFGWLGLLSLLAFGTIGCSGRRENAQIASEVQNKIRTDGRMQMARVQVLATNGVVTLSGYVASPEQRLATVQDAAQIRGVRIVVDNLRVIDQRIADQRITDPSPRSPFINPIIATQKPLAPLSRPANPSPGRPSPRIFKASDAIAPPAGADRPVVPATAGASSAPAETSPIIAPAAPVTSERHAIASMAPAAHGGATSDSLPVGALPAPTAARQIPPAEPEPVTVPYGTELVVRLTESLSSDINEKGDTFLASLSSPIMVGDRVVIPAEAGVEGKVIDVQSAGRFSGRPKLAVEMTRLTYNGKTYELRSSQYSKQGASRDTRSVAAIGGGAGVGAIIGAVLGGGRGAAIGSVIGAGVGTGAQAASQAPQVKLPAESVLSFRLQGLLTIIPSSILQSAQRPGAGNHQDPFSSDDDRPVLKRRPGSPPPEAEPPDASPSDKN